MSYYLDTSVLLPLFISEPTSEAIHRWYSEDTRGRLFIADLVATEFSAVVSQLVRSKVLDDEEATAVRARFELWRGDFSDFLENLPADIRAAGVLVRSPQPRLLAADATHLATCLRLGLTLVTHDTDLQVAAAREGITWESPAPVR